MGPLAQSAGQRANAHLDAYFYLVLRQNAIDEKTGAKA
jgi:hypothetical protein